MDFLPLIIHPNQSGFTKGQTVDATCRLVNIIHLAQTRKMPPLILALDAEKVFDSLELSVSGFECLWISRFDIFSYYGSLYQAFRTGVYIWCTIHPFFITNSTHQGCPLPSLIFNLLMEPLATYIHPHPQISGFLMQHRMHTISLFADDIILILTDVEISLPSVQSALQLFN